MYLAEDEFLFEFEIEQDHLRMNESTRLNNYLRSIDRFRFVLVVFLEVIGRLIRLIRVHLWGGHLHSYIWVWKDGMYEWMVMIGRM